MNFFKKSVHHAPVTCEDVVEAFSQHVQKHPLGGRSDMLPFDAELIKAALVSTSVKVGTEAAYDAGRTGFALLNTFLGTSFGLDLSAVSEDAVHATLDKELDALDAEFDARVVLTRTRTHA